ncbi:unnamed protein product [Gordionus sp. m RMFG-2023]
MHECNLPSKKLFFCMMLKNYKAIQDDIPILTQEAVVNDTIKSGQKKFPRSSEKFHSSTIKDDDENFQEPAIKNLKLNAEENHMKVMNILNSIVGEDYNYDGVKTPEKASKMLEPNDIRPFGAPPERTGMAQNAVYGF